MDTNTTFLNQNQINELKEIEKDAYWMFSNGYSFKNASWYIHNEYGHRVSSTLLEMILNSAKLQSQEHTTTSEVVFR